MTLLQKIANEITFEDSYGNINEVINIDGVDYEIHFDYEINREFKTIPQTHMQPSESILISKDIEIKDLGVTIEQEDVLTIEELHELEKLLTVV